MENSKAKSCCISKDSLYNCGILLFRCIVGGFMLTHGWQKLQNFDMLSTVFPDPLGVGSTISLVLIILAEFGCSLLIIIGLFTRLATFRLFLAWQLRPSLYMPTIHLQQRNLHFYIWLFTLL